jgi:hypothetical protein
MSHPFGTFLVSYKRGLLTLKEVLGDEAVKNG